MEAIVGALVRLGIRRVRLTGGEPLVRKDILEIARRLKALPGLENLALSTNGTGLARLAPALREAGIDRVNVSLDSLDPELLPRHHPARRPGGGLERRRGGPGRRARPGQAQRRAAAGEPGGRRAPGRADPRPAAGGALHRAACRRRSTSTGRPRTTSRPASPWPASRSASVPWSRRRTAPRAPVRATSFRIPGARGTIGFITPLSHTFCADCNRLRLTARGELRLCLFADRVYPLRHLIGDPEALEAEILRVLQDKPAEHRLTAGDYGNLASFMQIGG